MEYYVSTITSKMQLTLPKRLCVQLIDLAIKAGVTIEHGAIVLTPMREVIEAAVGSLGTGRSSD